MSTLYEALVSIASEFRDSRYSSAAMRELAMLEEIRRLREELVSGFYEDDVPMFTQGRPVHELQSVVTAEECTGYVTKISMLRQRMQELARQLRVQSKETYGVLMIEHDEAAKWIEEWVAEDIKNGFR